MIIVRNVFRLKFGKAKEVKAIMQDSKKIMNESQLKNSRVLFDVVGPAYTMVLENSYGSLADFEKEMSTMFSKPEWGAWYQRLTPLVEQSYREVFSVMEYV